MAARKFADVLLQADCCLYSQHLPGQRNTVADSLSRNFDRSNEEFTTFILSTFSSQVPPSFKFSPLPPDILSWLTSWLRNCRERMGLPTNTRDKEARVWRRWNEYTKCINFNSDIWLQRLTPDSRTVIFGAFAAALRRRQFSRPDENDLASATVQEPIAKLGEIFRANVGYNPAHVPGSHTLHPALARQFKGMRNTDPGEKQQKALPVCVYREICRMAYVNKSESSDLDVATADILTLAFFFCMRSCEYSEMQGERRTKILCMRNIRFYNERNQDITNKIDELEDAVSISLTFEFQKKDIRNETISHQKSGDKLVLGHMCPVKEAVNIVRRIHSYGLPSEKFPDTQINMVR
jgi:hypothetical protein